MTKSRSSLFIILLLSGYYTLPRERMHWSLDRDLRVDIVANSMLRNRYYNIKKCLHLADNSNLHFSDKLAKIRPLMIKLNKNFSDLEFFRKDLSIDEIIVRYYAKRSAKQIIRSKPVRFGYKSWLICSSNIPATNLIHIALGSKVVLDLLDTRPIVQTQINRSTRGWPRIKPWQLWELINKNVLTFRDAMVWSRVNTVLSWSAFVQVNHSSHHYISITTLATLA